MVNLFSSIAGHETTVVKRRDLVDRNRTGHQRTEAAREVETVQKTDAEAAMVLYSGSVMHARLKPVTHRFVYSMSAILIDLDRLEAADRQARLFSVNARNLLSFNESDFGPRDGTSLRAHVDSLLHEAGLSAPDRIRFMCYPRVLGYCFNPLCVYFCEDAEGALNALIYEVRNTFGEHHTYVEPVRPSQLAGPGIRQETPKLFYVSPFMDMDMTYRFSIATPGERMSVRIMERDRQGPVLTAAFQGRRHPANDRSLLATVAKTLGLTWKVTAGIHFEAARLWLKGMRLRKRKPHLQTHSLPAEIPNDTNSNMGEAGLR